MGQISLTGNDLLVINGNVFTALADGNWGEVKFPNQIGNVKTGKNSNSIYAFNAMGAQCELMVRLLIGSADDKFLNNLLIQQNNNFSATVLLQGEFSKNVGDGSANVTGVNYILSNGIFTKIPEAKSNAEGDVEQSVVVYTMMYSAAPRIIG